MGVEFGVVEGSVLVLVLHNSVHIRSAVQVDSIIVVELQHNMVRVGWLYLLSGFTYISQARSSRVPYARGFAQLFKQGLVAVA